MSYYLPFPEGPVRDPDDFIGREREVVELTGAINAGRSRAIIGPTGAGKRSLLRHMLQALPVLMDQPPRTALVDLSDVESPADLYRPLLQALGRPGDDEIALEEALEPGALLVGLEGLEQPGPGLSGPARSALRSWVRQGRLQLLAVSTVQLAVAAPFLSDELGELKLGPMPEREARALVEEMLERAGRQEDPAQVGTIVGVAGGYPGRLRRATELWVRSAQGSEFDWRRTFREEYPEQALLDDTISPHAPRLEVEETDTRFSARLTRRMREAVTSDARKPHAFEEEDISPLLAFIFMLGTLALALSLAPSWPVGIATVVAIGLLAGLALPWLGLRLRWQHSTPFQIYLAGLAMFPGMRRLLRRMGHE